MIQILIPTYNRKDFLLQNLSELTQFIQSEAPETTIVISDNASTDGTEQAVKKFFESHLNSKIHYYKNEENIGLERNVVKILEYASSDYIMFLGDDDFILKGYLAYCQKQIIENKELGAIMPSKTSISTYAMKTNTRQNSKNIHYDASFESALSISHYANQMSGLVLRNPKELLDSYNNCGYRSIYLFIYFFTYNLLKNRSIMAFEYPVAVTTTNQKDWNYNEVGLLDEVFKAYYPFDREIGKTNVNRLLLKFTKIHGWRFNINVTQPFQSFLRFYFFYKRLETDRGNFKLLLFLQYFREYFHRLIPRK